MGEQQKVSVDNGNVDSTETKAKRVVTVGRPEARAPSRVGTTAGTDLAELAIAARRARYGRRRLVFPTFIRTL